MQKKLPKTEIGLVLAKIFLNYNCKKFFFHLKDDQANSSILTEKATDISHIPHSERVIKVDLND